MRRIKLFKKNTKKKSDSNLIRKVLDLKPSKIAKQPKSQNLEIEISREQNLKFPGKSRFDKKHL